MTGEFQKVPICSLSGVLESPWRLLLLSLFLFVWSHRALDVCSTLSTVPSSKATAASWGEAEVATVHTLKSYQQVINTFVDSPR